MEELGASDEDPGLGGGQPEGIRDVIQGGSVGAVAFLGRRGGSGPPAWNGPW